MSSDRKLDPLRAEQIDTNEHSASALVLTRRRRLGVLLATGPAEGDFPLVSALIHAALREGRDVGVFLMDDGAVYAVDPRFASLLEAGAEATVCAMDAETRGVDAVEIAKAGVVLGGQHDHASLLRRCDQFLCFT